MSGRRLGAFLIAITATGLLAGCLYRVSPAQPAEPVETAETASPGAPAAPPVTIQAAPAPPASVPPSPTTPPPTVAASPFGSLNPAPPDATTDEASPTGQATPAGQSPLDLQATPTPATAAGTPTPAVTSNSAVAPGSPITPGPSATLGSAVTPGPATTPSRLPHTVQFGESLSSIVVDFLTQRLNRPPTESQVRNGLARLLEDPANAGFRPNPSLVYAGQVVSLTALDAYAEEIRASLGASRG